MPALGACLVDGFGDELAGGVVEDCGAFEELSAGDAEFAQDAFDGSRSLVFSYALDERCSSLADGIWFGVAGRLDGS